MEGYIKAEDAIEVVKEMVKDMQDIGEKHIDEAFKKGVLMGVIISFIISGITILCISLIGG